YSDMIDSRLSYEYENEKACRVKSKYSVTELNRNAEGRAVEEKPALNIPAFAAEAGYEDAAARGTVMHTVMDQLDLGEAYDNIDAGNGADYLDNFVSKLTDKGVISAEQEHLVSKKRILEFFGTDLGRRAAEASKAKRLRKEAPFNVLSQVDGVEVMVQGVIDCYFEEDDGLVLLDYKTNYIDKRDPGRSIEKVRDIYRGQLLLYKDALEQITGKNVKEVYLYLFSAGEPVKI
ncbi:MAG: PD-(D/E)XK nuclease family protein, partial [Firmicutes bacterium]|nr:PD-(D/E)XK nuclease family protein [Bacillota bacterium]